MPLTAGCAGAGLGLRIPHIHQLLEQLPAVPWLEVHIDNFLQGGLNRALLEKVASHYPLSFHSVNLNLGGVDPLNRDYLALLKLAVDEFQPLLVSDHACFTALAGEQFHDLLPLPFTRAAVAHMAARIDAVQEYLQRPILLENLSQYLHYPAADMNEAEFLSEVCAAADCGLLLDLNNVYVNHCNHGTGVASFIDALPLSRVGEIHLAGYQQLGGQLLDTHGAAVSEPVWEIFRQYCHRHAEVPCLIEWDNNLPDWSQLDAERARAQAIMDHCYAGPGGNAPTGELRNGSPRNGSPDNFCVREQQWS